MDRRTFIASASTVPLVVAAGCIDQTDESDGAENESSSGEQGDDEESAGSANETDSGERESDEEASEEVTFLTRNYGGDQFAGKGIVLSHLVVRGSNALSRESLLAGLQLQQTVRQRDTIAETLTDRGIVGLENVVGTAAVLRQRAREETAPDDTDPTLDEQIAALQRLSEAEFESLLEPVLESIGTQSRGVNIGRFLPRSYAIGSPSADSRRTLVFQAADGDATDPPSAVREAQEQLRSAVDQRFDEAFLVAYTRQPPAIELRGDVTNDDALSWVQTGTAALESADTVFTGQDGELEAETPVTAIKSLAASDETFGNLVAEADTTGDGIPDQNLGQVYDALLATDPGAKRVIWRGANGEYRRLLLFVSHRGSATEEAIVADLASAGAEIERQSDGAVMASVTIDGEVVSGTEQ